MKSRRTLNIVAVVMAVFSALAVYAYSAGADRRAIAELSPVDVVVTKQLVATGISLGQALQLGLVERTSIPAKSLPAGAVQRIDGLNQDYVALSDVPAGQILLQANFSNSLPQLGPLQVPTGMVAISVELNDPEHVAGFLVPGSDIVIFDTAGIASGSTTIEATRVLLPRVTVLAVGSVTKETTSSDQQSTDPNASSALITVAVTPSNATKLVHGIQTGKLYMGLLDKDTTVTITPSLTNKNIFGK